jgi:hypothetical protein
MHVLLEQKWQKPKNCSECKNDRKTYTRKNKAKMYVQAWSLKDQQNTEKLQHAHAHRQEQHIALCTLRGLTPKLTPHICNETHS